MKVLALKNKRILIAGYGREGKSTYRFLRSRFPEMKITIADIRNIDDQILDKNIHTSIVNGQNYLDNLQQYDLIFKSPGVKLPENFRFTDKIISQTSLMLDTYGHKVIGITGTKGKSTTSALIHHILSVADIKSGLIGNIGVPPLNLFEDAENLDYLIFEMSAHQLEHVTSSPYISVFLNIFEEHLDHFNLKSYRKAKSNIFTNQKKDDLLIFNLDNGILKSVLENKKLSQRYVSFSVMNEKAGIFYDQNRKSVIAGNREFNFTNRIGLKGNHNIYNIMAAVAAAKELGVNDGILVDAINSFQGLPHRLEYAGTYGGVIFYNDSIATIPEATIEALNTLGNVKFLILGGLDRGISYSALLDFISGHNVTHLILCGKAGKRMLSEDKSWKSKKVFYIDQFSDFIGIVRSHASQGDVCLLSPAAASYDEFPGFEERGATFKQQARLLEKN